MTDTLTVPCDVAAEQITLGACMLAPDTIAEVADILRPEDFYKPVHAIVFEAMLELYERGEPVQPGPVFEALVRAGQVNRVGGGPYLAELVEAVPTVANATWYAGKVAERAKARRLLELGHRIVQGVESGTEFTTLLDRAERQLAEVTASANAAATMTLKDLVPAGIEAIERAGEYRGKLRGLSTRLMDLDRLLNGLQPGQLIVVAGRPGAGKSVLATDLARAAALYQQQCTLLVSLEMSQEELFSRIVAAEARLNLSRVLSGDLSDGDWMKLARRAGEIADAPLHVVDTPGMTLLDIRSIARRLKRQNNLSLLVVDYLQLVTTPKSENRQVAVSELSRGLKLLAKELQVPVVAVAQLNRGSEHRADKRPQLSDLRESGALEQDSDVVILVHREEYYDKESPRAGEADLIVAKNRNGPTDTVTVAAQLHHARFVDMAIV